MKLSIAALLLPFAVIGQASQPTQNPPKTASAKSCPTCPQSAPSKAMCCEAPKRTKSAQLTAQGRVSFYSVPLVCPAAPNIACGHKAKPLLLELERKPAVAEAWLNRAGTTMAIVWKERTSNALRIGSLKSISSKLELTNSSDKVRREALKTFRSPNDWFRGGAVDTLSKEEADIIAARLIRRVKASSAISKAQENALQPAFAAALRRTVVRGPKEVSQAQVQHEILKIGRSHLDSNGQLALQRALVSGYRPLPNEK